MNQVSKKVAKIMHEKGAIIKSEMKYFEEYEFPISETESMLLNNESIDWSKGINAPSLSELMMCLPENYNGLIHYLNKNKNGWSFIYISEMDGDGNVGVLHKLALHNDSNTHLKGFKNPCDAVAMVILKMIDAKVIKPIDTSFITSN